MKIGQQFAFYVQTVLQLYQLPCNKAVIRLLAMIAAHESGGFRYVQQMNNGPAKGLLQMEPVGLMEVQRYLRLRPEKFEEMPKAEALFPDMLVFDAAIAIACARVFFMAKPEPLPHADDIEALARYAKKHWNTEFGKATWQDYADAYRRYCKCPQSF
ncbi:hypothetical protein [Endozoicomonas montiporae]|uniref:Transglycosylase SLT domain-containing protein n=1 Tax=Endozoicomonas montiporae CL-33 TaxID=570277 RepID=A0A142BB60_9GAMM|nr:hypothetical protein [Endozoicomonas montiporae]AMO55986.1 hypothetical protein EZMO1_1843 [Endozoicomonas montiporae CL-33]